MPQKSIPKVAFWTVAATFIMVVFQNCGSPEQSTDSSGRSANAPSTSGADSPRTAPPPAAPATGGDTGGSSPGVAPTNSEWNVKSLLSAADFAWSVDQFPPKVDAVSLVLRWLDVSGKRIALFPPLLNSVSGAITLSDAPKVLIKNGLKVLSFANNASLVMEAPDANQLLSENYTIFTSLSEILLAKATASKIRLWEMRAPAGSFAGDLTLEVSRLASAGKLLLTAAHWTDVSNYSHVSLELNEADFLKPMTLAIRFGKNAEDIRIAANWVVVTSSVNRVGDPKPLMLSERKFTLHPAGGEGSLSVMSFGLFRRALSDFDLLSIVQTLAQRLPSTIGTPGASAGPTAPVPTATPALPIPNPISTISGAVLYAAKCTICHGLITTSSVRRISLTQLNNAISGVSRMSGLKSLSDIERRAIVSALQ